MLEFIDKVSVLIIVAAAVGYLIWFFWNTLRLSSRKPCGTSCKCGPQTGR